MPTPPKVKPTQKAVKTYYAALKAYAEQDVAHEGAVRSASSRSAPICDQTC